MKFWTRHKPVSEQEELFIWTEKIGQVAKHKMEYDQVQSVIEILDELETIFFKTIGLRKTNIQKFYSLYLTEEARNELEKLDIIDDRTIISDSINYKPTHRANQYLLGVFYNIWQEAFKMGKIIFCRATIDKLVTVLVKLSLEPKNRIFIEYILTIFEAILENGIKTNDEDVKKHICRACFQWYIDIKFLNNFELGYLELFENQIFKNLKIIIVKKEEEIFRSFVRMINTNFRLHALDKFNTNKIFKPISYNDKHYARYSSLRKNASILKRQISKLYTIKKYIDWKKQCESFRLELEAEAEILSLQKEVIDETIDEGLIAGLFALKLKKFQLTLVSICAYILFKENYNFLAFILNYKQPHDADAHWVNPDIFPISIVEILHLLENYHLTRKMIQFSWEDRHGSEIYLRQFIALLIPNGIATLWKKGLGETNEVGAWVFDSFSLEQKRGFEFKIENIKEAFYFVKKNEMLLKAMNFSDKWINDTILPLFDSLEEARKESIASEIRQAPVIQEEVSKFKEALLMKFNQIAKIRNFLKLYGTTKPRIGLGYPNRPLTVGINTSIEKQLFIQSKEEATMYSPYATRLADTDNNFLIIAIKTKCKSASIDIKEYLTEIKSDWQHKIILTINLGGLAMRKALLNDYGDKSFLWANQMEIDEVEQNAGLIGKYNGIVPVYEFCSPNGFGQPCIIVLDKRRMGTLIQFIPGKEEDEKFMIIKSGNMLFYRFEFYSENDELHENALATGKYTDRDLLQEGWLQIYVKADFRVNSDFEGLIFKIEDS